MNFVCEGGNTTHADICRNNLPFEAKLMTDTTHPKTIKLKFSK